MSNLPPELAASLEEVTEIYTGLDLDGQEFDYPDKVSGIRALSRKCCDFCAQGADDEPLPLVAIAPGGQAICRRCAGAACTS
jgi:hypothetical protein